jgi:hypothetical protein
MTPVSPDNQFLTVHGAAVFSGVAESSIRNWIARGTLPAKKVHGRPLIESMVLERLIQSHDAAGPTPTS